MFKAIRSVPVPNKSYMNYIIEDTNFSYIYRSPGGTGSVEIIIQAYTDCNLPVASNLAKFYLTICKNKNIERLIANDEAYYNKTQPSMNYSKYTRCMLNQIKKFKFIGS